MNISKRQQMKIPFTTTFDKFIKWFTDSPESICCLHPNHGRKFCFYFTNTCIICLYIGFKFHITNHLRHTQLQLNFLQQENLQPALKNQIE